MQSLNWTIDVTVFSLIEEEAREYLAHELSLFLDARKHRWSPKLERTHSPSYSVKSSEERIEGFLRWLSHAIWKFCGKPLKLRIDAKTTDHGILSSYTHEPDDYEFLSWSLKRPRRIKLLSSLGDNYRLIDAKA